MRVLGVDPGLNVTGYGIIDSDKKGLRLVEAGVVRTSPKSPLGTRLKKVYTALSELIDETRPEVVVLEKLYSHYKHPTTAILMGHVRGAISLLAEDKCLPLAGYGNTRIKKAVIGKGSAQKDRLGRMVEMVLGLKTTPKYNDITDALALAIAHVRITETDHILITAGKKI
ncbi:MAG: crossover junction endodeoxyribonuclease RuvC [Candidatus Omnitrophica bacterium]|nr:crossover junction endodeoxyribonuclease RuvC [Candidatus Omnitrophota bacterium]